MALLVIAAVGASLAPRSAEAQGRIGVFGGSNFAHVTTDALPPEVDLSSRTGFQAGGLVGWDLGPRLSLELQPMFQSKGSTVRISEQGVTAVAHARFNYLELPLLVKYSMGSGRVRPYVLAGPTLGFSRSAKVEILGVEEDIKDQIKSTDFGVGFGGGVRMPAGRTTLFAEGQYTLGLKNIYKPDPGEETEMAKNRGFQLKIGMSIPLSRRH